MDEKDKKIPEPADFLMEDLPLEEEPVGPMPELTLDEEILPEVIPVSEEIMEPAELVSEEAEEPVELIPEEAEEPVELIPEEAEETMELIPEEAEEPVDLIPVEIEESAELISEDIEDPVELIPEDIEDPVELIPEDVEEPAELIPEEIGDTVNLVPEESGEIVFLVPEVAEEPALLPEEAEEPVVLISADTQEPVLLGADEGADGAELPMDLGMSDIWDDTIPLPDLDILLEDIPSEWDAPADEQDAFFAPEQPAAPAQKPEQESDRRYRIPRKGRPKRQKGYGLFGLPHLAATIVWLGIIVMIGTSLGRMLWVCAADVLAFGRESKKVTVTITSNDTIDEIAAKLHDAELIRYPELFKLYASLAVDDGDILPGTFEMDTLYDYHALVVQMGPRSSTREIVADLLIPEGLNCRQIFELLEQNNVCTVAELEEYAANGEFADFWFLEGVERGDKYCLEGFLFPDTYDFYMGSTPREALGKMLLGFQSRVEQEKTMTALAALNERLSGMMRSKGCSEQYIAENQLSLRDLLIVASLIEEETASSKESPLIASVIFNRLTEDQVYERYLGIDAALIYATGSSENIDTSIDHPYNTYKNAGLTPGPISNPGLDSIYAALEFEDSPYYYYVLNPETGLSDFSKTKDEHDQKVDKYFGGNN